MPTSVGTIVLNRTYDRIHIFEYVPSDGGGHYQTILNDFAARGQVHQTICPSRQLLPTWHAKASIPGSANVYVAPGS